MSEQSVTAYSVEDEENVCFSLSDARIIENSDTCPWFCEREHVKAAIAEHSKLITVNLLHDSPIKDRYAFRMNSRSIQIGCMRFTGKHATALKKWAVSK